MAVIPLNNPASIFPLGAAFYTWGAHATGDTGNPITPSATAPLAGAVQGGGTFGGATLSLEQSVNGVDWAPVYDLRTGVFVALTSAAQVAQISSASQLLRTIVTGGTSVAIVPSVYLRG